MSGPPAHQILTERQIAWCRCNIKSFSEAWQNVQNADAHRLEVYKALGVEPGALPGRRSARLPPAHLSTQLMIG